MNRRPLIDEAIRRLTGCDIEIGDQDQRYLIDQTEPEERHTWLHIEYHLTQYQVEAVTRLEFGTASVELRAEHSGELNAAIVFALLALEEACFDAAWQLDHRARLLREIRPKLREL
jgi:hypothetical protein